MAEYDPKENERARRAMETFVSSGSEAPPNDALIGSMNRNVPLFDPIENARAQAVLAGQPSPVESNPAEPSPNDALIASIAGGSNGGIVEIPKERDTSLAYYRKRRDELFAESSKARAARTAEFLANGGWAEIDAEIARKRLLEADKAGMNIPQGGYSPNRPALKSSDNARASVKPVDLGEADSWKLGPDEIPVDMGEVDSWAPTGNPTPFAPRQLDSGLPEDQGGALFGRTTMDKPLDPSVAAATNSPAYSQSLDAGEIDTIDLGDIDAPEQVTMPKTTGNVRKDLNTMTEALPDAVMDIGATQRRSIESKADDMARMYAERDKQLDELRNMEAERKNREAERNRRLAGAAVKIDEAAAEAQAFEVHDGGLLKRNPGLVLMSIGAIFGAALSARTGQPNDASQAIENVIARDIQAQKDRYAQLRQSATDATNAYGRLKESLGDERTADLVAEANSRKMYADELENMANKSNNEEFRRSGLMFAKEQRLKAIDLKRQALGQRVSAMDAAAAAEAADRKKMLMMQIQHQYDLEKERVKADVALRGEARKEFLDEQKGLEKRWVPGFNGFAATEQDAEKFRLVSTAEYNISKVLDDIDAYTNSKLIDPLAISKARTALRQKINDAFGDWKDAYTKAGGSLTDTEKETIPINSDVIMSLLTRDGTSKQLTANVRQIMSRKAQAIRTRGALTPGAVQEVVDPLTNQKRIVYARAGVPDAATDSSKGVVANGVAE